MVITAIYATGRTNKSTTYNLSKSFIEKLSSGDEVFEFHLPKAMPHFCIGCYNCLSGHEDKCPHYEYIMPISDAFDKSDLIIFAVPVYVYHAPGQVKALLDHFSFKWLPHRPNGLMFKKQVLIICTAAGLGISSTVKDVKDSLDYWGVAKVHTLTGRIMAGHWDEVNENIKRHLEHKVIKVTKKIKKISKNIKPSFKVKSMFYFFRLMKLHQKFNLHEVEYWGKHGWLGKARPWRE